MHAVDVTESLAYLFEYCQRVFYLHLLRQVGYSDIGRHRHTARTGALQTGDDFEHGRFACAVFAYEGDFVARVYYIIYIVEECFCTEFDRQTVN